MGATAFQCCWAQCKTVFICLLRDARELLWIHFRGPDGIHLISHDGHTHHQSYTQRDPHTRCQHPIHMLFLSFYSRQ